MANMAWMKVESGAHCRVLKYNIILLSAGCKLVAEEIDVDGIQSSDQ